MAETSDHHAQSTFEDHDEDRDPDVSPEERDAREATELARVRRQYSRASTSRLQGSSTTSHRPTSIRGRFRYSVTKFWKHQVSIVVPHDTCRDHLGMDFIVFDTHHSSPGIL